MIWVMVWVRVRVGARLCFRNGLRIVVSIRVREFVISSMVRGYCLWVSG